MVALLFLFAFLLLLLLLLLHADWSTERALQVFSQRRNVELYTVETDEACGYLKRVIT